MAKQHYMTEAERYQLEGMLRAGKKIAWIARELGFCRQTIYNEIQRGLYMHTIGGYRDVPKYSAYKAQMLHQRAQQNKGRELKIGKDFEYANFLETKILNDRFSPAAALAAARSAGFRTSICIQTLYNYIDQGVFLALTNNDLWEKTSRKPRRKGNRPKIVHKKLPSIEKRPEYINQRSERGHWEMDLMVGGYGSRPVLLTLTERVTREEIILKLPNRKAITIRKAINRLERETPNFKEKFKSISTDNGQEFMEYDKLIRSVHGGKRFDVWYCHSYAAWEKGSNENTNRIIRRFFPKGTDFSKVGIDEVQAVEDWLNDYPRKILQWKTPRQIAEAI